MKFGVAFPNSYEGVYGNVPFATPHELVEFAHTAENLGYDSLWGLDLLVPSLVRRVGRDEPQIPTWYELLVALSYIAATTERIQLGTGVIIVPLREPVLLAKQLATLDRLSKGRAVLGVGVGASRHEFESLRPMEAGATRAQMMEESLEAMTLLLSRETVSYKGQYVEFEGVSLAPRPVQNPLPVYISGNALKRPENVARRVAKWGHGWLMSVATNSETLSQRLERLYPLLQEQGRDLSEVDVAAVTVQSIARDQGTATQRYVDTRISQRRTGGQNLERFVSRNLIGTPEQVVKKVDALQRDGATSCVVTNHAINSFQEFLEQVQWFAEDVMPHFSD